MVLSGWRERLTENYLANCFNSSLARKQLQTWTFRVDFLRNRRVYIELEISCPYQYIIPTYLENCLVVRLWIRNIRFWASSVDRRSLANQYGLSLESDRT